MVEPALTRISSRGRVTIPAAIREAAGVEPGTRLLVLGDRDTIVLKVIRPPAASDMGDVVGKIREAGREAGITPRDVENATRAARSRS